MTLLRSELPKILFQSSLDWTAVWKGTLVFAVYAVLGLAAQQFRRKDVLA
jgi:hypothetical protein